MSSGARAAVLGPLKRAKGGEGGGLGCWWRAALKAGRGRWLGQVRGRARLSLRRRRGAPSKPSRGTAWRRRVAAAMGRGEGQRACKRGTHGRQWPQRQHRQRQGAASCSAMAEAEEQSEGREKREKEIERVRFDQNLLKIFN